MAALRALAAGSLLAVVTGFTLPPAAHGIASGVVRVGPSPGLRLTGFPASESQEKHTPERSRATQLVLSAGSSGRDGSTRGLGPGFTFEGAVAGGGESKNQLGSGAGVTRASHPSLHNDPKSHQLAAALPMLSVSSSGGRGVDAERKQAMALFGLVFVAMAASVVMGLAATSLISPVGGYASALTLQFEVLMMRARRILAAALHTSPAAAWAFYSNALSKGGLVGLALKGATASAAGGAGDCVSQALENGKSFDLWRFSRFTILGSLVSPWIHYWYMLLNKIHLPGGTLAVGVQQMAIDQVIFSPVFLIVTFGMLAVLEGKSLASLKSQLKRDWAGLVCGMWIFWVPAKLVSFTLLPHHFRLLFDNVVGLIWNTYLSSVANRKQPPPNGAEGDKAPAV